MAHADSPSAWARRLPVVMLALVGLVIASYLTAFQLRLINDVWDPLFGAGSRQVLTSFISRVLPVPDAALGALAYAVDIVLEMAGGEERWRTHSWYVLAFGGLLAAFALTSVVLVATQLFVIRALCTLCLCSAGVSLVIPLLARDELAAAAREVGLIKTKEVA
jgi:uncharacterized membrane protein